DVVVDRGVIMLAAVDVDTLDLARTVLEAQRLAEHGARDRAVGIAPGVDLVAVGRIDRLVVGIVERLLVHVEPDERPLGACERCGLSHAVSTCNRYASPAESLGRRGSPEQPRLWSHLPPLGPRKRGPALSAGDFDPGPRFRGGETEKNEFICETARASSPPALVGLGVCPSLFPFPQSEGAWRARADAKRRNAP